MPETPETPSTALDRLEHELAVLVSQQVLSDSAGLAPETNLYEAGLDSMSIMQLLVLVEQQYGVVIPDGDLTRDNFASVRALARVVHQRLSGAA